MATTENQTVPLTEFEDWMREAESRSQKWGAQEKRAAKMEELQKRDNPPFPAWQTYGGTPQEPGEYPDGTPLPAPAHHFGKPDQNIATSALQAANWLAEEWPEEVAKVGRPMFIAQRVQEVLSGAFPAQYWEPCPLVDEQTKICYPNVNYNAPQPPQKFVTPASRNTICRYDSALPSYGNASNAGHTTERGYFVDDWLKQKHYVFQVPAPLFPCPTRPAFSKHSATFTVSHSHKNRQAYSNLYRASWAPDPAGFSLADTSVDAVGRYFFWHRKTPAPAPNGSTETMTRAFVVDARFRDQSDGYDDTAGGFALVQVAPAPPRGTYRYKSLSVFVDQQNTIAFFVAKPNDSHDPACSPWPPTLYSWAPTTNPQITPDTGIVRGGPCRVSWYRYRLCRFDFYGNALPWYPLARYLENARLRGRNRGKHITVPVYEKDQHDIWTDYDTHPPTGTDLECGPHDGTWQGTGLLTCSAANTCEPHEAYEGWGYRAWDSCNQQWKAHTIPGPAPTQAEFNARWMAGKYPL